jgi:purine-binding chemotaxis protein CheW
MSQHLVTFVVDGLLCSLPMEQVEQVVAMPAITPLPRVDGRVLGVIDLHGSPCPVINLRRLLGLPEAPIQPEQHLLIVKAGQRICAIGVDQALDVAAGDVLPVPGDRLEGELIQGLSPSGGLLNLVLDTAYLLDAPPLAPGSARQLATAAGMPTPMERTA